MHSICFLKGSLQPSSELTRVTDSRHPVEIFYDLSTGAD